MRRTWLFVLIALLLPGCSVTTTSTNASAPVSTNLTNNTVVQQPAPPDGFEWFSISVRGRRYQYPAKQTSDVEQVGLLTNTPQGIIWTNPLNEAQILLSPPGTVYLHPSKAKVLYTCTPPAGKPSSIYSCSVGGYDTSPYVSKFLFFTRDVFQGTDQWHGQHDIFALNLNTGKTMLLVKNMVIGGGDNFFVAYHSHYFIYDQMTPTISDYMSHVHVIDLNSGTDSLFWTGEHDKMPALKIPLDDGTYRPKWLQFGADSLLV